MISIVPFENINNMHHVAENFSSFLSRPDNEDIALDFPGTVRRYGSDVNQAYEELMKTRELCQKGIREQFVIYAGEVAVGLSAVQLVDEPPEGIEPEVPNLSGMIFNPWRGKRLGTFSLLYRLNVVNERFNGRAYSEVRKANVASQKLVEANGLVIVGEDETRYTYLYEKQS